MKSEEIGWENRYPNNEETCIYIGDGYEPYLTHDTSDMDVAVEAFCATYNNGANWEGHLTVELWQDGDVTDVRILRVRGVEDETGLEIVD